MHNNVCCHGFNDMYNIYFVYKITISIHQHLLLKLHYKESHSHIQMTALTFFKIIELEREILYDLKMDRERMKYVQGYGTQLIQPTNRSYQYFETFLHPLTP